MRINIHNLAVRVTQREGLKKSLSIAQVKEVIRLTLEDIAEYDIDAVVGTIEQIRKKKRRKLVVGD